VRSRRGSQIAAMAGTNDINIIAQSTKPGYDAAVTGVKMYWKKLFGRGKLGVMSVAGGLALVLTTKGSPVFHIIVAVLILPAVVWFVATRAENERSLTRARAELLPELDRAFAEGRYVRHG